MTQISFLQMSAIAWTTEGSLRTQLPKIHQKLMMRKTSTEFWLWKISTSIPAFSQPSKLGWLPTCNSIPTQVAQLYLRRSKSPEFQPRETQFLCHSNCNWVQTSLQTRLQEWSSAPIPYLIRSQQIWILSRWLIILSPSLSRCVSLWSRSLTLASVSLVA